MSTGQSVVIRCGWGLKVRWLSPFVDKLIKLFDPCQESIANIQVHCLYLCLFSTLAQKCKTIKPAIAVSHLTSEVLNFVQHLTAFVVNRHYRCAHDGPRSMLLSPQDYPLGLGLGPDVLGSTAFAFSAILLLNYQL